MKIPIYESGNKDNKEPERKFCLFPRIAVDCHLNLRTYIVWLEWITWNEVYDGWTIEDIN